MKEHDCRKQNLIKQISNSPDKGFKVRLINVIKMLIKFRRMDKQWDFNSEVENIGKSQKEIKDLKNTIIKLKHNLQEFNSKLNEAGERTSQLADRAEELTH